MSINDHKISPSNPKSFKLLQLAQTLVNITGTTHNADAEAAVLIKTNRELMWRRAVDVGWVRLRRSWRRGFREAEAELEN